MEFDPHTLHKILQRIRQQMRCPQCGEQVPVDFACVKITGDDFVLLQLRCELCDAYIVLHASLQGMRGIVMQKDESDKIMNASTSLLSGDPDVEMLRNALESASGSFEQIFEEKTED